MASSAQKASMVVEIRMCFQIKPRITKIREDELKFILEQAVDFQSFKANMFSLKKHFEFQGWMNQINMLNDPTYSYLVKDFWIRAEAFDEFSIVAKLRGLIA